eukprot:7380800-Prymnesium_polylepis.2
MSGGSPSTGTPRGAADSTERQRDAGAEALTRPCAQVSWSVPFAIRPPDPLCWSRRSMVLASMVRAVCALRVA